jgi:hypothetical protein
MNWIKQIDRYLLLNHPNIWITRIHYVLPATLLSALLIFVLYSTQQFRIDREYPSTVSAVLIMSIPVVVGFAFWLVFQARYNVMKSGGRHEIWHNAWLFMVYLVVIWSFFLVIMAPIWGTYNSVKHALPKQDVESNRDVLRKGFELLLADEMRYDRETEQFFYTSFAFSDNRSDEEVELPEFVENIPISKVEFEKRIGDFETLFLEWTDSKYGLSFSWYRQNVYANQEIDWEFEQLLSRTMDNLNVIMGENYFHTRPYDYYRNPVRELQDIWFWRFWLSFFSYMALLLVFFKLMHWRDFALGLLALLTNLFVTSIMLGMVGISGGGVSGVNAVLIFVTLINVLLFVQGGMKQEKKWYSLLAGFSIAFYAPILVFVFAIMYIEQEPHRYIEPYLNQLFYLSYGTGLLALFGFSYFFKRYWWLPSSR